MTENNSIMYERQAEGVNDGLLWVIGTLLILSLVLWFVIGVWKPFADERRYIKMEMARSDQKERKYWERRYRRLYLNLIPFYRVFTNKK